MNPRAQRGLRASGTSIVRRMFRVQWGTERSHGEHGAGFPPPSHVDDELPYRVQVFEGQVVDALVGANADEAVLRLIQQRLLDQVAAQEPVRGRAADGRQLHDLIERRFRQTRLPGPRGVLAESHEDAQLLLREFLLFLGLRDPFADACRSAQAVFHRQPPAPAAGRRLVMASI